MKARERCEMLRNFREKICETNGIEYKSLPCIHHDWCPGYCSEYNQNARYFKSYIDNMAASGTLKVEPETLKLMMEMLKMCDIEPVDNIDDDEAVEYERYDDDLSLIPCNIFSEIVHPKKTYSLEKKPADLTIDVESVCKMCEGCGRYQSLVIKEGKAVSCPGLSEHSFDVALKRGRCMIKNNDGIEESEMYYDD